MMKITFGRSTVLAFVAAGLAAGAFADNHGGAHGAKDTYALDKDHTTVGFSIRHLGLTNVRGLFGDYDGYITLEGDDLATLKVKATIKAASVDTNNERRDNHLRNVDFFDVDTHEEITFHSKTVIAHGEGHAVVGDLTIKNVTKEVTLPVKLTPPTETPWGDTRIGVAIHGEVNRHDFGVAMDGPTDLAIGNTVTFDINVQAIRK